MGLIRKLLSLPPKLTSTMRAQGLAWAKLRVPDADGVRDFVWVEVCDVCGGNCGQCGTSLNMSMAPSLDNILRRFP